MSPSALFFELQAAGVTLTARGDRLKVEAARGTITPELLARMKAAKPDLLAILTGNTPAISGLSKPRGSIPNDTASVDTVPAPDLPLLEALEEFDALDNYRMEFLEWLAIPGCLPALLLCFTVNPYGCLPKTSFALTLFVDPLAIGRR